MCGRVRGVKAAQASCVEIAGEGKRRFAEALSFRLNIIYSTSWGGQLAEGWSYGKDTTGTNMMRSQVT